MGENSPSHPSPLMGEGKGGGEKLPIFTVVQSSARSETQAIGEFGFDPGKFSKAGNSTCVFCGMVADSNYVKQQAQAKKMGQQLMAVVCTKSGEKGKIYLSGSNIPSNLIPKEESIQSRISKLCSETGLTIPEEPLVDKSADQLPLYGMTRYYQLFTASQLLTLLTLTKWVRKVHEEMIQSNYGADRTKAVVTALGLWISRSIPYCCSLASWHNTGEKMQGVFARQAIPMVWDFAEVNLFGGASGNWCSSVGGRGYYDRRREWSPRGSHTRQCY
jgi:putative DNA methylase